MSDTPAHTTPHEEAVRAMLEPLRGASQHGVPSDLARQHIAAMVACGRERADQRAVHERIGSKKVAGWLRHLHVQRRAFMSAGVATAACALFAVIALGTASDPVRSSVDGLSVAELPATSSGLVDGTSLRDANTPRSARRSRGAVTPQISGSGPTEAQVPAYRQHSGSASSSEQQPRDSSTESGTRSAAAPAPARDRAPKPEPTSGKNNGSSGQSGSPISNGGTGVVPESGDNEGGTPGDECSNPNGGSDTPGTADGGNAELPVDAGVVASTGVSSPPSVVVDVETGISCGGQQ